MALICQLQLNFLIDRIIKLVVMTPWFTNKALQGVRVIDDVIRKTIGVAMPVIPKTSGHITVSCLSLLVSRFILHPESLEE